MNKGKAHNALFSLNVRSYCQLFICNTAFTITVIVINNAFIPSNGKNSISWLLSNQHFMTQLKYNCHSLFTTFQILACNFLKR